MTKLKYFGFALFVAIVGLFCSACQDGIFAKTIYLIDYSSTQSVIEIETNQKLEAKVGMTPSNITDREFEAFVLDEGKQNFLSFEYDYSQSILKIIATSDIGNVQSVVVSFKLKAKKSSANSIVRVKINGHENPQTESLPSPEVSYDGNGNVVWTNVSGNSGFVYQIYADDELLKEQIVKNVYKVAIDVDNLSGKSITAKVKAKGKTSDLDSEYAILNFDVLPIPTNLAFDTELQKIVWDEISHASGYNLKIGSKVVFCNTNSFDGSGYFDLAGVTNISVKAVGTDDFKYISSKFSEDIAVKRLAQIAELSLQEDVLSWNEVEEATKYKVEIKNENQLLLNFETQDTFVDLSTLNLQNKKYEVYIKPSTDEEFSVDGKAKQFAVEKLSKVSGLRHENGRIAWNSSATGYKIFIDGELFSKTNQAYFDYSNVISQFKTRFDIVAVGDNTSKISSDLLFGDNDPFYIYKLTSPELQFDGNGTVNWQTIDHATGYKIVVDNKINIMKGQSDTSASVLHSTVDFSVPTSLTFVVLGDAEGKIAENKRAIYLNSNVSNRTITKLPTANLQFGKSGGEDCLMWNGINAFGYQVYAEHGNQEYVSDIIYQSEFMVSDFVVDEISANEVVYKASVVAIAGQSYADNWFLNSDKSEVVEIIKLPNVSLSVASGKIVWNYLNTDNILGFSAYLQKGEQKFVLSRMLPEQKEYDFSGLDFGEYEFNILAVGDSTKNYLSSSLSKLNVEKLQKISALKIEKQTTQSFANSLDRYVVSFDDLNDGNANYECFVDDSQVVLNKDGNEYIFDVYATQIAEKLDIKIKTSGDSEKYISCEDFDASIKKANEPIVSTNKEGTAIKTNANQYFGLVKGDGIDNVTTFEGNKNQDIILEKDAQFKIKNVLIEEDKTLKNGEILTVDSLYSQVYKVNRLAKPQLYVESGTLKVRSKSLDAVDSYFFNFEIKGEAYSCESKNFENLNGYIKESDGRCAVFGYFTDKNTGSMNDGVIYLRSENSDSLSVEVLPKPTNLFVRDGVIYVEFAEGKTIFGGKLSIYINGEDKTPSDNTQTSYEFAKNHKDAGKYTVKARAISQMSGSETLIPYSLHGEESDTISITKLATVSEMLVTAFAGDEGGTIASFSSAINSASRELPGAMPYQTGFLKFKTVDDAVKYVICDANDSNKKIYIEKPVVKDGYVYINLQQTEFVAGQNEINIIAIGNSKEIVDSEVSENFEFTKLKTPENIRVQDGKIIWSDSNNPNNSSLENDSVWVLIDTITYPKWLLDSSKNAIVYYALVNGKYICTLDLSSMINIDIDKLCQLTNNLKELSFDPSLDATTTNVYTIQLCATAINSYIDATLLDFVDQSKVMSLPARRTDNIYINSDFSSSILVSPINAPYGLTIDDGILSWITPYSDPNSAESILLSNTGFEVTGYQLKVYKDGEIRYFGTGDNTKEYAIINGATNNSWNFKSYLATFADNEGNYSFEVKTLVSQKAGVSNPERYYINSAYSLSFNTTVLKTPELGEYQGKIAWQMVNGSSGYIIVIDEGTANEVSYNSYDNQDLFENDEQIFIFNGILSEGNHTVKIKSAGGDEKTLISSLFSSNVNYTKLKAVNLYVDANSGIIQFGVENQYRLDSDRWSYFVDVEGFDVADNSHMTIFDLSYKDNPYQGGKVYKISVCALRQSSFFIPANEGNDMILNSDASNELLVYKLLAPSKFDVIDNYQSISWKNNDKYATNVSYVLAIADNIIANNIQTKYSFETSGEVNAIVSVSAIYNGTVKINGIDYNCLKSDANEYVSVHKLSMPTNIKINDGVMSWTRSLDAETHLIVSEGNEIVDKDSYDFAKEEAGSYSVRLYNLVQKDLRNRTDKDIYLSSKYTDFYNITKLDTPTNFDISQSYNQDEDFDAEYEFVFKDIVKKNYYIIEIYDNENNLIYSSNSSPLTTENGIVKFDIDKTIENLPIEKLNQNNFKIVVKAIGSNSGDQTLNRFDTYYASSNANWLVVERIDQTEEIIPEKDFILNANYQLESTFTGKLAWKNVDLATKYIVEIEYLDEVDASEYIFENFGTLISTTGNKKMYEFADCYAQIAHCGDYSFKVISMPQVAAAQKIENIGENFGSYKKILQSAKKLYDEGISYSLFLDGEGTQENPYILTNFEQFNCIKYNIHANYKLASGIDYGDAVQYDRKLCTIDEFYGEIDGNNKTLTIAYSDNFAGIVNVLKEGAKIKNLTISGTVASMKVENNQIVVGSVASKNYGTIDNCLNKINLICEASNVSTIGGIAGINYGSISKSGNISSIKGNFVGGIVGKSFGNLISECYNVLSGSASITSNVFELSTEFDNFEVGKYYGFAGGIVGYIEKQEDIHTIKSCYNISTIYCDNAIIGQGFVGGIAGYVSGNGKFANCYAVDSYNQYTRLRTIRAEVSDRAYCGILVGYINSNDDLMFENCASDFNSSINSTLEVKQKAVGGFVSQTFDYDGIVGILKNGTTEYQYIFEVVSTDNQNIYVSIANKYCTLANAKYN